jgi:putative tricarboxylic transport membrane protein
MTLCTPGWALDWKPSRPVAMIVGAAPGGSIDLTARILQRLWEEQQIVQAPMVVINKPGAGNGIAWSYLNERGADGHAISIGTTNLVSNPVIGAHKLSHKDVAPLAILFDDYMGLVVKSDSHLKQAKDVAGRLRRDPGALSVAFAPALDSGSHTAAAVSLKALGINVKGARFVVYKSAGEALIAMYGGQIDIVSATAANLPGHIQSGRLRVLAVTAPKRLGGALAGVPTLREQGFDGVFTNWRAVIGPAGMRKEHVAYWEKAIGAATSSAAWQRELERNFWTANLLTGAAAKQFIEKSAEEFRLLWTEIGVTKP